MLEIVTNTVANAIKSFSLVTKTLGLVATSGDCFRVINKRVKVGKSFLGPVFALLQNKLMKIMQIKSVYLQTLT